MHLRVPKECYAQIEELAEKLHISCSSVVRMSVARWYHDEPVLNGNGASRRSRDDDGDDHPRLQD